MPNFQYKARDINGQQAVGVMAAASASDLREQLRKKKLFVTDLKEKVDQVNTGGFFKRKRPKLEDMVVMSRQLATLVKAGLPIVESLDSVYEQTTSIPLKNGLAAVRKSVLEGSTMTD